MKKARQDMRDLVFRHLVKHGRASKELGDKMQALGLFAIMDVVDEICDALVAAQSDDELTRMASEAACGG